MRLITQALLYRISEAQRAPLVAIGQILESPMLRLEAEKKGLCKWQSMESSFSTDV